MAKRSTSHSTSQVETSSQKVSQRVPRGVSHLASSHFAPSDVTIAKAIAVAVRSTPGVVALSPGLLALAATYGPNERFVGVVVLHPGPHDTAVDVHVTVAMEAAMGARKEATSTGRAHGAASPMRARTEPPDKAALIHVADQAREAVYRAMRDLHLSPPSTVDIFIDDIQMPV